MSGEKKTRLTPFGVIDRYFYQGDDGRPVLSWGSFHAQRIINLLAAEGYTIENTPEEPS